MKKLLICTSLLFVVAMAGVNASAQCDRNTASPIRCGFYDEGYQDGAIDARNNQNSDYRRYRLKFSGQYENFYRDGYEAGYESVRPVLRWTASQRNAYNAGYTIGQSDRRNSNETTGSAANSGGYDQSIGLYFQQGYSDGFNNRPRTYDVPITVNPGGGGGSGSPGTASWSGRVDANANIIIRGNTIRTEDVSGTGLQVSYQNINGALPRRSAVVSARKTNGRGDVRVIQQPNRSNDYTAIVQISDPRGGADNYGVEISWTAAANVEEPYRSGSVRWRGRVDKTANIVISGGDVQTQDASGTGVSGVSFDINGYLAHRPGSVTARKRNGRGTVIVLQQPSWDNDFTAIVQVSDPGGGADNYEVEISW